MAFDIRASIRLVDMTTRPLRSMTSALSGAVLKVGALSGAMVGITGAAGVATGAIGLFSKAIKGASNLEQNMISMEHFIGLTTGVKDAKTAAEDYLSYLRKNADFTPFSTTDVIDSGRRLINVAGGDISLAKKLLGISEDMAALNPGKSLNDAVEAIADLKVGETERMKEFGFKITQKDIKAAGGAMKIMTGKVSKMFEGGSDKLSESAAGMWSTVTGTFSSGIADMGVDTLNLLKPQLKVVADYLTGGGANKLFASGSRLMASFTNEIIKGAYKAGDYIQSHFTNNPAFTKLTTLKSKISFVVDDLWKTFSDWLNGPGKTAIENSTASMLKAFASAIERNAVPLSDAALSVGKTVGKAIVRGIGEAIESSPVAAAIIGGAGGGAIGSAFGPAGIAIGAVGGAAAGAAGHYSGKAIDAVEKSSAITKLNGAYDSFGKWVNKSVLSPIGLGYESGRKLSGGISRVPYNGMPAVLHRDEAVLTRGEAREYRNNGGSGGGVNISGNTFHVREEADIEKVAAALYRMIDGANNGMGNAYAN